MPSKHRASDSEESSSRSALPPSKRRVRHASRACDECRRRKIRCDGIVPQCTICKNRDSACEYKDEDRRKTNLEHIEDINARMDRFEKLVENLLAATTASKSMAATTQPLSDAGLIESIIQTRPNESSSRMAELPVNHAGDRLPAALGSKNTTPSSTTSARQMLHNIDTLPVTSSRLRKVEGGPDYELFQRVGKADAALVQHGPTSLWTCASSHLQQTEASSTHELRMGDWIDWSRNLPSSLNISKAIHDQALDYFAAFYAPWCLSVDMPAFLVDLNICNMTQVSGRDRQSPPSRTAHYSPLLHCCVLYLGLRLIKQEHPALVRSYESIFMRHCSALLFEECDHTALSSLRAYNLFSNCAHFVRLSTCENQFNLGDRQHATGYLYSGMAIAGVHALGLNLNCENYVRRGQMTPDERNLREYAFWTTYLQDTIRALAAGRQPILVETSNAPFPQIDSVLDDVLWSSPTVPLSSVTPLSPGLSVSGLRSMRSTAFHWMARLAVISRSVLETLYSSSNGESTKEESAWDLLQQLETWHDRFPLAHSDMNPLPHVLLLLMTYHLVVIFILRPFYRSTSTPIPAQKCQQAAQSILYLLDLFESVHGLRFCHHNLINAIFGAATIFLLGNIKSKDIDLSSSDLLNFNRCVDHMSRLSLTWTEAAMSHDILVALQAECEQPSDELLLDQNDLNPSFPRFNSFNDMQDIWGLMFPDQAFQWHDLSESSM
ncbi:hypothetical protein C356_03258 [Cryptococcus neoformans c45]|nr:hypothetical protein C356_03258 [Cryptococcus neoformans var. grubii c45]